MFKSVSIQLCLIAIAAFSAPAHATGMDTVSQSSTPSIAQAAVERQQVIQGAVEHNLVLCDKDRLVAEAPNTELAFESEQVARLHKGTIVVSTRTPLTVKSYAGDVVLDGDAVVLVSLKDDILCLVNLSTNKQKNISLVVDNGIVSPPVGMQCIISKSRPSYRQIFRNPTVGQNGIDAVKLSSAAWLTTSNVALEELLLNDEVLVSLTHDQQNKEARRLVNRVAKTAACINAVAVDRVFSHIKS